MARLIFTTIVVGGSWLRNLSLLPFLEIIKNMFNATILLLQGLYFHPIFLPSDVRRSHSSVAFFSSRKKLKQKNKFCLYVLRMLHRPFSFSLFFPPWSRWTDLGLPFLILSQRRKKRSGKRWKFSCSLNTWRRKNPDNGRPPTQMILQTINVCWYHEGKLSSRFPGL